jgi:hypothetical protein
MTWKDIEKKRLSITTLNLSVKAIRIDDKAFTVTLFNQLPCRNFGMLCLDDTIKISIDDRSITTEDHNINIIGYVRQKSLFLLGIEKEILYRIQIDDDGWKHRIVPLIKVLEQLFIGV